MFDALRGSSMGLWRWRPYGMCYRASLYRIFSAVEVYSGYYTEYWTPKFSITLSIGFYISEEQLHYFQG
jgi:hypothetical protein